MVDPEWVEEITQQFAEGKGLREIGENLRDRGVTITNARDSFTAAGFRASTFGFFNRSLRVETDNREAMCDATVMLIRERKLSASTIDEALRALQFDNAIIKWWKRKKK